MQSESQTMSTETSILNDIYVSLYEIKNIIYKAKLEDLDVNDWEQKIEIFEKKLFSNINKNSNEKFAKLFIEANNLKNKISIFYLKRSKNSSIITSVNELEETYQNTYNKIDKNNSKVINNYDDLENKKRKIDKFHSIKKALIPSAFDVALMGSIISVAAAFTAPVNTMKTNTYSSQTHKVNQEYQKNIKMSDLHNGITIRLYSQLTDEERKMVEYKLESGERFDDAIIKAEELLNSFANGTNSDTDPYYEIISFYGNPISLVFILGVIISLILAGFLDNVLENEGIMIKRICQSLKANIIWKKDLKKLIELAKQVQRENSELANEFYSLYLASAKDDNFDLIYEKIEELKNKPDEYIRLARKK